MANETTFPEFRCGFSVSELFHDTTANMQGKDSFVAWYQKQIQAWPLYQTLFSKVGTSERLVEAFCHTSFEHENQTLEISSYERMEFLGDAVLDLLVSNKLLELYPKMDEGSLSKLRGALVNEENLSLLAKIMDLGSLILLGKGESRSGGAKKEAILADAIESSLAVFYLEGGMDLALEFFDNLVEIYNKHSDLDFFDRDHLQNFDSKTRLQETTMALFKEHPEYLAKELDGGRFEVAVSLKGKTIAKMVHPSKKKAEKLLANKIIKEKLYEEVKNVN